MQTADNSIEILDFIFHVVHHGEDNPILMEETPITGFEYFFKERIKEVLNGNKFFFNPESSFLNKVKHIDGNQATFLEVSKQLAKDFHAIQDDRIKPGVMILMRTKIASQIRYILIKYDHENVIYYTTTTDNRALLNEISNTFSKSKEALQKSAIIHLDDEAYVVVIDKSERSHITKFFKSYLGIKRSYTEEDLTTKIRDCYLTTVKYSKNELPKEFTSSSQQIFFETVQKSKSFETEEFLKKAFGTHYSPEIKTCFERELRRQDLFGEEFNFFKNIKAPRSRKYRTSEGVQIQFPDSANDTVDIKHNKNETVVTIRTKKLTEE
jgi:hypothetical protein